MSILSRAKAKAKKVLSKVVSTAKNYVSNVIGGANIVKDYVVKGASGVQNTAGVGDSFNKPKGTPYTNLMTPATGGNATQLPLQTKASGPNYSAINSSGGVGTSTYGPSLPKTISSTSSKSSSGGGGSTSSLSFNQSAFTGPITTSNLGAGSSRQGAVQGGGGYNAGATSSNSPYSLPTYNPTDPGNVDTTAMAGSMAGYYTRKDDGTFEPVTQDPFGEKSDSDIAKEKAQLYKDAFGEQQSVYDDPEVIRAQKERRRAQEALLAPTAQLNAVLGQAQADTLRLRQTAQKEGVVEAVYGAQAASINYNAAIQALPLQSNIAALQGNLELADSYLNELVTKKKEWIDSQYQYNKGLFDTIYSALDAKEKRVADAMVKENDRQYKAEDELIDYKAELVAAINASGDPNAHVRITAVERAKDKVSASKAAGDLTSTSTRLANQKAQAALNAPTNNRVLDTLPTSIQGKVIAMANAFGDKTQIKKYIEAVDSVNIVNGIDSKSKNPADHQQIVYAFAKALDPDSAVREGEYATIKKYAQGAASRYGKEISNAIAGTGFLSEGAISNIKTTIANTLNSRKPGYDNSLKETARVINNIAGSDVADELLIDYSGGVSTQSSGGVTPELESLRSKYSY